MKTFARLSTLAAYSFMTGALTAGAALLAGAWMLMKASEGSALHGLPLSYLALAAALYALSFWTRSVLSRHLLLLSFYLFVVLFYWRDESSFTAPILLMMDVDPVWLAVIVAINLQTSFLTPPFGFSLFYLRGVAPASISTWQIYRGVTPFVLLQLVAIALLLIFPQIATWLPHQLYGP